MGVIKTANLHLSVSSDIDALHESGYKSMEAAADLVNKAIGLYKDASSKFGDAQKKADQGITMTKELGIDGKAFDAKKANSKNAQAKADKNASISILQ